MVEDITTSLEENKYTVGIFIDLKRPLIQLIMICCVKKLHFYGLCGVAQDWVQSYLENKKTVCQGSILGPKFVIMYINDICNVSQVFIYILFADDTNLLCCDRDLNELVRMINVRLEQLQMWFSVNRLFLNTNTKTNYMIFGNRRIIVDICLRINKENINRVNSTTEIDCKLNWKSHILSVRSKLSKCFAIMYRASSLILQTWYAYFVLFSFYALYYVLC